MAIKAFEAGHDILLKPKDPVALIAAMAAAVQSGRIAESRIDEAALKLLTLKARLNLHKNRFVDEARVGECVGTPAHLAHRSGSRGCVADDDQERRRLAAGGGGRGPGGDAAPAGRPRSSTSSSRRPIRMSCRRRYQRNWPRPFRGRRAFICAPGWIRPLYEVAWKAVREAELVVFSLFVPRNRMGDAAPFREADLKFLQQVIAAKPKAVVAMSYGNPQLIRKIPDVGAFLIGYGERGWFGNQTVYFETFVKALKGEIKPAGKLPVTSATSIRSGPV